MTRARSEYRVQLGDVAAPHVPGLRQVGDDDRDALAGLILDAYRGTIDDEGEDLDDAYDAIDEYLGRILREHSFVLEAPTGLTAMCFAVAFDGSHYIDPIAVGAVAKRTGVGRAMVETVLASLARTGVREVGATITDGNTASERLFTGLGFARVGAWT